MKPNTKNAKKPKKYSSKNNLPLEKIPENLLANIRGGMQISPSVNPNQSRASTGEDYLIWTIVDEDVH